MVTLNRRRPNIIHRGIPHRPDAPILDVSGVSVRYNGNFALEDISFQLSSGVRVAVVGPNGAGKSTLFKVIAGVLEPNTGRVQVSGGGPGSHICIAYVPQRTNVDWDFPVSVSDVVMMGRIGRMGLFGWPKTEDWDLVHQSLEVVGMADLAHRQISELSGGQQQRMFIARALVQEAELMLMDEPLTGLDLTSQEIIFQSLEELGKRGVTVLVAMHDLKTAAQQFDLAMLLNRRLLGIGKPEEIFTPEHLVKAYGDHLHIVNTGEQILALSDTCCEEGDQPAQ
jgi:manganese/iron transport system ATP-binding protein